MKLLKLLSKQRLLWKIICIFWFTTLCTILANIYITKEIAFSEFRSEHFKEKTETLAKEAIQLYEIEGLKALRKWYKHSYQTEGLRVVLLDSKLKPIGRNIDDQNKDTNDLDLFTPSKDIKRHLLTLADHEVTSSTGQIYTLRILPSPALRAKFNPESLHLYRFLSSFIIIFIGSFFLYRSIAKPLEQKI
jgi:two-component system sensor histidine kinase CpxA